MEQEKNKSNLYLKSMSTLEYDKVKAMLADCASTYDGKTAALDLTPSSDADEINQALRETSDACELIVRKGAPYIGGINNVMGSLKRAELEGVLSMAELLEISTLLRVSRTLREWREKESALKTCLDGYFNNLTPNRLVENRISSSIIDAENMSDDASPELHSIRRSIRNATERVREILQKMLHSSTYQKYLQEPIITLRSERFVLPVKAEFKGEIPGLVHDTSSSGATLFVEPMAVVEQNNQLKLLLSREEDEINRILAELSAMVAEYAEGIGENYKLVIKLDFIFAKATLSRRMNAAPPLIEDSGLELKKARHPLIDTKRVVPIDVTLGRNFDTLVITGPNTGGKTVALKTVGLLCLMAQSGLHIPADGGSKIYIFNKIFADIGDEQSIEQSLSTFSSHMANIVNILSEIDYKTLVLFDELGAGTDPTEGAALAISILEHTRQSGALAMATTHYAELKLYALQTEGVENAACEFDLNTLCPTYRLLIGVPGKSNAFEISTRLGLTEEIVDRARDLISAENIHFEDILTGLERERQTMEEERIRVERAGIEAEQKLKQIREELENAQKAYDRELDKARKEARMIISGVRAQSEVLLNELEEIKKKEDINERNELLSKARQNFKRGMSGLQDIADPVREREPDGYILPREIRKGDSVEIKDLNKKAQVIDEPDSSGNFTAQVGIMKMKLNISGVRLIESETKQEQTGSYTGVRRSSGVAKNEIDVRGMTAEEAILEVDGFIDDACMAGFETVTVIHGKGTGALRNALQVHFRTHKSVLSFRLGKYGEGETGVSILTLK